MASAQEGRWDHKVAFGPGARPTLDLCGMDHRRLRICMSGTPDSEAPSAALVAVDVEGLDPARCNAFVFETPEAIDSLITALGEVRLHIWGEGLGQER